MVVARPIPLGPIVTVCPLRTVVRGVLPGVIRNVLPSTTASDGDSENVSPAAVTTLVGWELAFGIGIVVAANPIPCGPMLIVCPLRTVVMGVLPGEIRNVLPSTTASDGDNENVSPAAITMLVGWELTFGIGIVVVANPIPCGPMLIVCPLRTVVMGVLPGEIRNVLPSTTASDGDSENVSPAAITMLVGWELTFGIGIVVVANPIPCGPMLIVCPLRTVVMGVLPGEIWNVLPSTTASDGESENVSPAAVTTLVGWELAFGIGIVVVANPIPCGPILIVCPLRTVVMGALPGEIWNVLPSTTASDGDSENVSPAAITMLVGWELTFGIGIVVVANPIPCGPMLIVCPLRTVVMGVLPGEIWNVLPSTTASDGESENVSPAAVTTLVGWELAFGIGIVVAANPIPFGPILIVCPLRTVVMGVLPGVILNVWPSTTASEGDTEKVRPPAATTLVG